MFFRKPRPAPPAEQTWEGKTLSEIRSVFPLSPGTYSNHSLVALLKRLDEITLSDANATQRDRVDASKIADALEQDIAKAHPQAAEALADARAYARHAAARAHYATQVNIEADKIAAVIGAPCLREILARIDGEQPRLAMIAALDAAMANNMTPEQAAPGILFGLLGAIGDNAAAERLTQKIVADRRSPQ
jgi:hypothetical protein